MNHRITALATAAAAAAVALTAVTGPANAEAVVYKNYGVQSNPPDGSAREHVTLDIPTGYDVDRLNWHATAFVERVDQGRTIIVDLQPKADTVRELRAERAELREDAGDSYREFAFEVGDKNAKVQARWSFTYSEPGTGDVEPFVSVLLMSGNQVKIVGRLTERDHLRSIRQHIRRSVAFPE